MLVQLADDDARTQPAPALGQGQTAEEGGQECRFPSPVRAGDGHPVCPGEFQVDRSQSESPPLHHGRLQPGHDFAAATGGSEVEIELPPFPGLLDGSQAGQGFLRLPHLGGLFLGSIDKEAALGLVVIPGLAGGRLDAAFGPGPLGADALASRDRSAAHAW